MNLVVDTSGFVHIGNLINFYKHWIKYYPSRLYRHGVVNYIINDFEVDAYTISKNVLSFNLKNGAGVISIKIE